MENKHVGALIIGIGAVMGIIVWIFNSALKSIVGTTCTHGDGCTMYDTIRTQTGLSLAIVGVIVAIGLYIMFAKPKIEIKEKIIIKKIIPNVIKFIFLILFCCYSWWKCIAS